MHEDNVLFTPAPTLESWLLRLTPGIEANYRRGARTFQAAYTFDAEEYPARLETLDDVLSRQEALVELRMRFDRRSSFQARGSFLSTSRPEEVLRDSGLLSLRRRSRSLAASALFTRELTRRLSWSAGYVFSSRDFERPDELIPKIGGVLHSATTGIAFRHSPLATSAFDYTARLFIQEEVAPDVIADRAFASHVVAYRFSHDLSRRFGITLAAGPRFSQALELTGDPTRPTERVDDVTPELLAEARYRDGNKSFDLRYTSSQNQAFGLAGFVDTQSIVLAATLRPTVRWNVEANPGFYRNTRSGVTTHSVHADFSAAYAWTRSVRVEASYVFQYQDRLLVFVDGLPRASEESTTRNSFLLGITVSKIFDLN